MTKAIAFDATGTIRFNRRFSYFSRIAIPNRFSRSSFWNRTASRYSKDQAGDVPPGPGSVALIASVRSRIHPCDASSEKMTRICGLAGSGGPEAWLDGVARRAVRATTISSAQTIRILGRLMVDRLPLRRRDSGTGSLRRHADQTNRRADYSNKVARPAMRIRQGLIWEAIDRESREENPWNADRPRSAG